MKKLLAAFCFLFCTSVSADVLVYGPPQGIVTGASAHPITMATFKTGNDELELTKIAIANRIRGSRDSLYLCELDSNSRIVSYQPLAYYMFTTRAEYGIINFFSPTIPTVLKSDTRYGLLWYSGSNSQAWTVFSSKMKEVNDSGFRQGRNFYIDNKFNPLNENLLVFVYCN